MKPFDPEWSVFSEDTGNRSREQQWSYRQPRHASVPPGQRCLADRSRLIAAPEFAERLRRDRVRAQLARQFSSGSTPALA